MSQSPAKKTMAPANNPRVAMPLPWDSSTDSWASSKATADINTPEPNAMIRPSILLLILNQYVSNPPTTKEEAANRPHKNALVIFPSPVSSAAHLVGASTD